MGSALAQWPYASLSTKIACLPNLPYLTPYHPQLATPGEGGLLWADSKKGGKGLISKPLI
jgi:hypothetical protein